MFTTNCQVQKLKRKDRDHSEDEMTASITVSATPNDLFHQAKKAEKRSESHSLCGISPLLEIAEGGRRDDQGRNDVLSQVPFHWASLRCLKTIEALLKSKHECRISNVNRINTVEIVRDHHRKFYVFLLSSCGSRILISRDANIHAGIL